MFKIAIYYNPPLPLGREEGVGVDGRDEGVGVDIDGREEGVGDGVEGRTVGVEGRGVGVGIGVGSGRVVGSGRGVGVGRVVVGRVVGVSGSGFFGIGVRGSESFTVTPFTGLFLTGVGVDPLV